LSRWGLAGRPSIARGGIQKCGRYALTGPQFSCFFGAKTKPGCAHDPRQDYTPETKVLRVLHLGDFDHQRLFHSHLEEPPAAACWPYDWVEEGLGLRASGRDRAVGADSGAEARWAFVAVPLGVCWLIDAHRRFCLSRRPAGALCVPGASTASGKDEDGKEQRREQGCAPLFAAPGKTWDYMAEGPFSEVNTAGSGETSAFVGAGGERKRPLWLGG